ncbi:MAG: PilZ domain-containing protein [Desulfobacteraceae bacterium]|nr:PilZ domain-containing protein [Desulfobacteraceae bacterium]
MYEDQRLHKRFKPNDDVFVSFNESYLLGKIRDISNGGLCFEYISTEESEKIGTFQKTFINIWTPQEDISIENLPCETVYDYKSKKLTKVQNYESRICGLRFLYTDDYLESELEKFKSKEVVFFNDLKF